VVQAIDGATGRVTVNPATVFTEYGKQALVCPAASGGAGYQAPAYSPLTRTMYLPAQQTCSMVSAVQPTTSGPGLYGMAARSFIAPEAGDNLGVIHAINAVTGRGEWTYAQRAGMQSLMTTGGGLLFAGDSHGRFRAMDQQGGEVLWEINLGSPVTGYPVTFEVDGHQYVAVSTGFWLADSYTPELIHGRQNTLYVFALPEAGIGHRGPVRPPINRPGELVAVDPQLQQGGPGAPSRRVGDGVFSAAQAATGRGVYARACAACHGVNFEPAPGSPPLKGAAFLANWRGRTLADLHAKVRTMPPGAAGSLPESDYLAALAYLLEANGFPAGRALPGDEASLRAIGMAE
jgi:alcohol dehydrogenase (cytochrome c)